MKIIKKSDLPLNNKTAVAIGFFDGVHIGHIELISDICAKKYLTPIIYTFNRKNKNLKPILTASEKCAVFESLGIPLCFVQDFNEEFSNQTPYQFLIRLVNDFNVAHIAVGFDFKFGKDAGGNAETLKKYSDELNYTLTVVPEIKKDNIKVSSSNIKDYISEGNLKEAALLMNRFYYIDGKVTSGKHLGAKIGFPTANISLDKFIPPYGVYASIAQTEQGRFPAVTNIGVKPTVQDSKTPNAETFIIHYNGELYGQKIRIYLVRMLRREIAFNTIDDLQNQIDFDSDRALELLKDLDIYKKYLV